MSNIQNIIVTLRTVATSGAGSNDPLYLGVVGSGGGSEFPLFADGFDDYREGSNVIYLIGGSYLGEDLHRRGLPIITPAHYGSNNPVIREIELHSVDYVYLRKFGYKDPDDDDAWKMGSVTVELYDGPLSRRTFQKASEIWLSSETGLQVWIPEQEVRP
jgi:hypothetical protein